MSKLNCLLGNFCLSTALLSAGIACAGNITGAGSTLTAPVYAKWAEAYKLHTSVGLNYQAIGSGNGIKQIESNTVDFGATDAPLTSSELGLAGLIQFPSLISAVVPVANITGVAPGQLKLDGKVLADIYSGKITKWNDSRIAADNTGLALPDEFIKVLYHSDASGTSFIFTTYLSEVSPEWQRNVGKGTSVRWPVGTGGKGNESVASYVQRIKNSIGYVGYNYALQNKLAYIQLRNRDGQFVIPDASTFRAAAANAKWSKENSFNETLTNETGKDSWPITGASYILVHKTPVKPESAEEVLKFFDWAFASGNNISAELGYVPLNASALELVRDTWKTQIKSPTGVALWK
jgi:phosphate transport system substrate-binding protein